MKAVASAATTLIIIILLGLTGCSAPWAPQTPKALNSQPYQHETETIYSTICKPIGLNGSPLDLCVENREGTPVYY